MKISKRFFFLTVILMISLMLFVNVIIASEGNINFPEREIEVVIPYGPGGMSDMSCRVFCNKWEQILGKNIMVVNKSGGGGLLGSNYVVNSKPDGYTLGWISGRQGYPEIFAKDVPYTSEDLKPLFQTIFGINALVTRVDDVPWTNLDEFITYAKDNPGLQYSNTGPGTGPNIQMEVFAEEAGIVFEQVPYGGDMDSLLALLSGDVLVGMINCPPTIEHYKAGKIQILALYAPERIDLLPEVPTFREQGMDLPLGVISFNGVFAPAGVPEEVENLIIETARKTLNDPETVARLKEMGFYVQFNARDEFKVILDEYEKIVGSYMKKLGLYQE